MNIVESIDNTIAINKTLFNINSVTNNYSVVISDCHDKVQSVFTCYSHHQLLVITRVTRSVWTLASNNFFPLRTAT